MVCVACPRERIVVGSGMNIVDKVLACLFVIGGLFFLRRIYSDLARVRRRVVRLASLLAALPAAVMCAFGASSASSPYFLPLQIFFLVSLSSCFFYSIHVTGSSQPVAWEKVLGTSVLLGWISGFLALLAVFSFSSACVGQPNGDGNNLPGTCLLYGLVVGTVFSLGFLPLLALYCFIVNSIILRLCDGTSSTHEESVKLDSRKI